MSAGGPPPLPSRSRGIQLTPTLPSRARVVQSLQGATLPPKVLSNRPIVPSRTPINANPPRLPVRTRENIVIPAAKVCGRTKPPKYEHVDFSIVDEYVRRLPEYDTTRELVHALVCNFDDTVEKYRAIFCWIAFNIAYDFTSFMNNTVPAQSTKNTFRTRMAVCSGYSLLFQELCDLAELKSVEISGMSKGYGFDASKPQVKKSDHAWNAVFVNNEWRMVDVTWGAGHIDTSFHFQFNPFYFLTDPDEFVYDHMPLDESFLHTSYKITWEQFVALNQLKSDFWRNDVKLLNHIDQGGIIRAEQGHEVTVKLMIRKEASMIISVPSTHGYSIIIKSTSEVAGFVQVDAKCRITSQKSFKLSCMMNKSSAVDVHHQVLQFDILVNPSTNKIEQPPPLAYPRTFGSSIAIETSLVAPQISPLPPRVTQEFVLEHFADDAAGRTLDLELLINDKPACKLIKSNKDGRVLYSVRHHVATTGEVKLAYRRGNSFEFLAIW